MMHYFNNQFYPSYLFGFSGFFFMILFWGLVVWGIVMLVKHVSRSEDPPKHEGRALDILKERYAKGEITKEQFEEMKKNIQ